MGQSAFYSKAMHASSDLKYNLPNTGTKYGTSRSSRLQSTSVLDLRGLPGSPNMRIMHLHRSIISMHSAKPHISAPKTQESK